jgi:hypothetical protein
MEIEFDFRKERSSMFGKIYRPVAKVILHHGNKNIPQIFYVDSGADVTLIPRSIGELLAFDNPTPQEIVDIKGIGEKGIPIVLRRAEMILGNFKTNARIGWALIEDVPLLLGREDFFKYFCITFAKNKKTLFKYLRFGN